MAADDKIRAGEGSAIDWVAGRSEMSDDLGFLVSSMPWPLDEEARAFLLTVGNAARATAKRAELAALAGAQAPARDAQTAAAPPAPSRIDWEELLRRRREQERQAMWDALGRYNQEALADQRRAFGNLSLEGRHGW